MTACGTCVQRETDPDEARETIEAMRTVVLYGPFKTSSACHESCTAIYRFEPGLVFRYKLACGHECERHDHEHRCCWCRGLRASGLARRIKL